MAMFSHIFQHYPFASKVAAMPPTICVNIKALHLTKMLLHHLLTGRAKSKSSLAVQRGFRQRFVRRRLAISTTSCHVVHARIVQTAGIEHPIPIRDTTPEVSGRLPMATMSLSVRSNYCLVSGPKIVLLTTYLFNGAASSNAGDRQFSIAVPFNVPANRRVR